MNDELSQLNRRAAKALNQGAMVELELLAKQMVEIDDRQAEGWFFLSLTAMDRKRFNVAIELIDRAVRLAPDNAEYVSQKARLHTMAGDREAAVAAANYAMSLGTDSAVVIDTLGVVYSRFELHEQARTALARGVEISPDNAQFHFNLASVEQFLGNAVAATRAYKKAIALKPDFYRAWWALSELEKNLPEPKHLAKLAALRSEKLDAQSRLYLGHALSREYEKAGDYSAAFDVLNWSKAQVRDQIAYDSAADRHLFKALKSAFPVQRDYPVSDLGDQNIFVLGMPRTGTTLVDRILGSHSKIVSMGEIQVIARAVKAVSGSRSTSMLDAELAGMTDQLNFAEIGRQYLYETGQRVDLDSYSIDKMPLNFLYVGHILSALPGARIVCLRRHPMDTCLSNYRQLFALNFSYYNYHYDLSHTAEYYALFDDLMGHWRRVFSDRFHEVHYEELVADPEPIVRRLCDFVGVPFEEACLNFHQSQAAVSTASAMQVREPLYASAVARWQRYGDQLKPAMDVLKREGIEC